MNVGKGVFVGSGDGVMVEDGLLFVQTARGRRTRHRLDPQPIVADAECLKIIERMGLLGFKPGHSDPCAMFAAQIDQQNMSTFQAQARMAA